MPADSVDHKELHSLDEPRLSVMKNAINIKYSFEFVIVKEDYAPLLGRSASEQMDIVRVNDDMLIVHMLCHLQTLIPS